MGERAGAINRKLASYGFLVMRPALRNQNLVIMLYTVNQTVHFVNPP